MNILKLAKHLREFTLEEINMIAECNCKQELQELLKTNKLAFDNGIYKFVEEVNYDFKIFIVPKLDKKELSFRIAVAYFMKNYVEKYCKKKTYRTYNGQFKYDILPIFQEKLLNEICNNDIYNFYISGMNRGLKPRKLKNDLALLNQIIRYFQNLGVIDKKCQFQVKIMSNKNEFN